MGTYTMNYEEEEPVVIENTRKSTASGRTRDGGTHQFVEFILGHENFAVNLFHTREVITPTEITPLPNAPAYITGIMDLRGIITTIVDLKQMMNIQTSSDGKKQARIIILDQDISKKPVGILVDDVSSVTTYAAGDIDHDADDTAHRGRSILGVIRRKGKEGGKDGHSLVLWLDIHAMIERISGEI